MTPAEIIAEWEYRITERLGNLCGANEETPAQRKLAISEADEWERRWRMENL